MDASNLLKLTTADGFFGDVVVYLVALQGFVHSTEIYNRGSAERWPADDTAEIHAKQMRMSLTWADEDGLREPDAHVSEF
jgi:hypothetical protein